MTNIIGITGQMHSGKSTVSALIMNKLRHSVRVENIKIAQPLYDMQNAIYDIIELPVPYPKDRELLQWLGTEFGRKKDIDLWINLWGKTAARRLNDGVQLVLCDDLRYENEAKKIKDAGGKILHVTAPDSVRLARGSTIGSGHISERGIPTTLVDAQIVNDGSLHDLDLKVAEILSYWEVL